MSAAASSSQAPASHNIDNFNSVALCSPYAIAVRGTRAFKKQHQGTMSRIPSTQSSSNSNIIIGSSTLMRFKLTRLRHSLRGVVLGKRVRLHQLKAQPTGKLDHTHRRPASPTSRKTLRMRSRQPVATKPSEGTKASPCSGQQCSAAGQPLPEEPRQSAANGTVHITVRSPTSQAAHTLIDDAKPAAETVEPPRAQARRAANVLTPASFKRMGDLPALPVSMIVNAAAAISGTHAASLRSACKEFRHLLPSGPVQAKAFASICASAFFELMKRDGVYNLELTLPPNQGRYPGISFDYTAITMRRR